MPENRFKKLFADADKAFDGKYKTELDQLMGLSKEEVDSITPDATDLRIYSVLVKVIEEASKNNIKQAQLVTDIRSLGEIAVTIAKKIPKFAALL